MEAAPCSQDLPRDVVIVCSAVFILCHAVKWIPNIWEWTQTGDNEVGQGNGNKVNYCIL